MIEPAAYDEKKTPSISMDGKKWPIPLLAPRQLREVWEPVHRLTQILNGRTDDEFARGVVALGRADIEAMQEVVYQGLTRAHPTLEREAFLDMAMAGPELVAAFIVVREQTGMYRSVGAKERGEPGEAKATDRTGIS